MRAFKNTVVFFIISFCFLNPVLVCSETLIWRGEFDRQEWVENWKKHGRFVYLSSHLFNVVSESSTGSFLEILHPKGSYSKNNKLGGFYFKFRDYSKSKATLSYQVKFEKGFQFGKGGKLPGLGGGKANAGGRIPNGSDGFSTRYMWREKGRLTLYCYLPTSIKHGTYFDTGYRIKAGKWHLLKQVVNLNDPGQANGSIVVQLDAETPKRIENLQFRTTDSLKIDGIIFSNFFGGSTKTWASPQNQSIYFKTFQVFH